MKESPAQRLRASISRLVYGIIVLLSILSASVTLLLPMLVVPLQPAQATPSGAGPPDRRGRHIITLNSVLVLHCRRPLVLGA